MTCDDYRAIRVRHEDGVAWLTLDNPPVNVEDALLAGDLKAFAEQVRGDESVRVVVIQSANPEFFSAHADFEWSFDPSSLLALAATDAGPTLNPLQQLHERLRTLPQVTIAKLRGYARAGGAELAMALDMRFAAEGGRFSRSPSH